MGPIQITKGTLTIRSVSQALCRRGAFTLTGDGLLGIMGVAIGGGLALLTIAHTLEWHKQYMKSSQKGKKELSFPTYMKKGGLCKDCFSYELPKYYMNRAGYKIPW